MSPEQYMAKQANDYNVKMTNLYGPFNGTLPAALLEGKIKNGKKNKKSKKTKKAKKRGSDSESEECESDPSYSEGSDSGDSGEGDSE